MKYIASLLVITVIYFGTTFLPKKPSVIAGVLQTKKSQPTILSSASTLTASPSVIRQLASAPIATADFQAESIGSWKIDRASNSSSVRISGGSWPSQKGDAMAAAADFLQRHGEELFNIRRENLIFRRISDDADGHLITYQQSIDGVPVYNSQVILDFDDKMNLVYASSQTYQGPNHSTSAAFSSDIAAQLALSLVQQRALSAGGDGKQYTLDRVLASSQYLIYLSGGTASNIYRFVVPLVTPLAGELEIMVDANAKAIVSVKNLARQ